MKNNIINELKYANKKKKNAVLGYVYCDYLLDMFEEMERLNNKEEQLIRRLEDLIIVGEEVENEWAVDICKMIIEELKGSDEQ